jgi:multidrug resistance efflux pump
LAKIKTGNIAEVEFVAYPGEIFRGRVVEVNPYIDI